MEVLSSILIQQFIGEPHSERKKEMAPFDNQFIYSTEFSFPITINFIPCSLNNTLKFVPKKQYTQIIFSIHKNDNVMDDEI